MEETETPQPTVVKTQIYTITVNHMSDGTMNMQRVNDGFNPLELLGICHLTSLDIQEQIAGRIKPDTITRQVIVDAV